jgi:hypothetical protein
MAVHTGSESGARAAACFGLDAEASGPPDRHRVSVVYETWTPARNSISAAARCRYGQDAPRQQARRACSCTISAHSTAIQARFATPTRHQQCPGSAGLAMRRANQPRGTERRRS